MVLLFLHGAGGYDEDRTLADAIAAELGQPVEYPRLGDSPTLRCMSTTPAVTSSSVSPLRSPAMSRAPRTADRHGSAVCAFSDPAATRKSCRAAFGGTSGHWRG